MNMYNIIHEVATKLTEELPDLEVYYSKSEAIPVNKPTVFPCIIFDTSDLIVENTCDTRTLLIINICVNTQNKRKALKELYDYREIIMETIPYLNLSVSLVLKGGTRPYLLKNINERDKEQDSVYFCSIIDLNYEIRGEI